MSRQHLNRESESKTGLHDTCNFTKISHEKFIFLGYFVQIVLCCEITVHISLHSHNKITYISWYTLILIEVLLTLG